MRARPGSKSRQQGRAELDLDETDDADCVCDLAKEEDLALGPYTRPRQVSPGRKNEAKLCVDAGFLPSEPAESLKCATPTWTAKEQGRPEARDLWKARQMILSHENDINDLLEKEHYIIIMIQLNYSDISIMFLMGSLLLFKELSMRCMDLSLRPCGRCTVRFFRCRRATAAQPWRSPWQTASSMSCRNVSSTRLKSTNLT